MSASPLDSDRDAGIAEGPVRALAVSKRSLTGVGISQGADIRGTFRADYALSAAISG
jgi:hypothetical protein